MNINKINTNLSFKGYENLISYSGSDDYGYGFNFAYMGMLLNNKNGHNDLDTWHEIQSELFKNEPKTDYLVLTNSSIGDKDLFILNNQHLSLKNIKNDDKEKAILKAYTLLASLTRRINYTDHHPENGKIYLTLVEIMNNLIEIFKDKSHASFLSTLGANKVVKHYETAEMINNNIARKMNAYFKL
jgi:hypothetical protein